MEKNKKYKNIMVLGFILVFNIAGWYLLNIFLRHKELTYESLRKPWFSISIKWLFIINVIFYLFLAFSVYFNYVKSEKNMFLYIIFTMIYFLWNYIFFVDKLYGISFLIMLLIILCFIFLGFKFLRYSKISSFIIFTYVIYLSYMALFNYYIWMYNEM